MAVLSNLIIIYECTADSYIVKRLGMIKTRDK